MSLDAFDIIDINCRTFLRLFSLRRFIIEILLRIMIATGRVVIILVVQELRQYLLDIFQSCLLRSESLLLGLHMPTEIIIMVIVVHVDRYNSCLFRADGGGGSVAAGFSSIV